MRCQLCDQYFPIIAVIDGVKKNLGNRKYCLQCSPFKAHNTRKLNEKWSVRHKTKKLPYGQWTGSQKREAIASIARRRKTIKKAIVEQLGGCCNKCKYKTCLDALHFHHMGDKKFEISTNLAAKSKAVLDKELSKCVVLCSNCHFEEHDLSLAGTTQSQIGLTKRRKLRKQQLIDMKGGGCKQCGYNKCQRSLQFHHRDPTSKLFGLDIRRIGNYSWARVLIEAEKCDLLCGNCHAELHFKCAI